MIVRHSDEYEEMWPRRKRRIRCVDGFCGADDCPTCRPGIEWGPKREPEDEKEET